jgi:acetamidase/formamidase
MFIALSAMLALIQERHGVDERTALALASVTVDLRITQICNGVVGVHACLPDEAIEP